MVNPIIFLAAITLGQSDYKTAYHATLEDDKPLVVLVGAEWCPGCKVMEKRIMPGVLARSLFVAGINYSYVDADKEPVLTNKLIEVNSNAGYSIPQLIIFTKFKTGWRKIVLIGQQTEDTTAEAISSLLKPD